MKNQILLNMKFDRSSFSFVELQYVQHNVSVPSKISSPQSSTLGATYECERNERGEGEKEVEKDGEGRRGNAYCAPLSPRPIGSRRTFTPSDSANVSVTGMEPPSRV
jgi:hypothetical protein